MIKLTVDRLGNISSPEEIFIITNRAQCAAIVEEVSGKIPPENVIAEPMGRNTSAAIGLAAVLLKRRAEDAIMLVLPADHIIEPVDKFENAVRVAASYVSKNGGLLTFGIRPNRPETGYGYIHAGEGVYEERGLEVFRAHEFLEKPDAEKASHFLEAGTYFWNSGMFLWKTNGILKALDKHLPDLYVLLQDIEKQLESEDLNVVLESVYPKAPSISIDYGVMEKAEDVVVLKADFDWNDVGSWEYIRDIRALDEKGNATVGEHALIDSSGNIVFSPDRLVGMIGVDNLVVVDAGDAMLICGRDRVQEVRKIVELLEKSGKEEFY